MQCSATFAVNRLGKSHGTGCCYDNDCMHIYIHIFFVVRYFPSARLAGLQLFFYWLEPHCRATPEKTTSFLYICGNQARARTRTHIILVRVTCICGFYKHIMTVYRQVHTRCKAAKLTSLIAQIDRSWLASHSSSSYLCHTVLLTGKT